MNFYRNVLGVLEVHLLNPFPETFGPWVPVVSIYMSMRDVEAQGDAKQRVRCPENMSGTFGVGSIVHDSFTRVSDDEDYGESK